MMSALRSENGFTIFELLVSLSLVALIMVHLSAALYQSRRVGEIPARLGGDVERQFIRQYLSASIGNAMSVTEIGQGGRPRLVFQGRSDTISFIVARDGRLGRGGLYRDVIEIEKAEEETRALVLSQRIFRSPNQGSAPSERRVLMKNIEDASFRYFGALDGERETDWHGEWKNQTSLPKLIELTIIASNDDAAMLPPLIVRMAGMN